jgi:hypothetical protein
MLLTVHINDPRAIHRYENPYRESSRSKGIGSANRKGPGYEI